MPTEARTAVRPSAFGCITVPFLLIALVPLGWGARARWNDGELLRHGETVPGRVVELRYVEGNPSVARGKGRRMAPVVSFATRTGDARLAVGSVNRHPPPWTVGDTVDVVYDPANPERADLRAEVDGWLLGFAIWCAVAAVPLAIALAPVALVLKGRREATKDLRSDPHD